MDTLVLKGLQYHAPHGVYESEKIEGNDFEVDLCFELDLKQAASTDDLSQTIDYVRAQELVASIMLGDSLDLIETLAQRIGHLLFTEFEQVLILTVTVRKLQPPIGAPNAYAQCTMKWQR